MVQTKLTRSESNRVIAGVCGGLAQYLDVDPVLVRLAFVILGFASGIGIPIYFVLTIITPKESSVDGEFEFVYDDVDGLKSAESTRKTNRGFVAGLLIVLGGYFLLANIGIDLSILAPIMLIGLGIWLMRRREQ